MRRWNGWGDDGAVEAVPVGARAFVARTVGAGTPPEEATLGEVVAAAPPSRLPSALAGLPFVSTDPEARVRHARGQSFPDWVALRTGRVAPLPDGVAWPSSDEEVRGLIALAVASGTTLIPWGGGTSVVGGVDPIARGPEDPPVLTVDLGRLSDLRAFDEASGLATFGAGVAGPDLEAQLRARGFTLGHYPQSFELSTLGGWVATRSSGQQSLGFGRIEQLFAGGRLEAPAGSLVLPPHPASAAGPDLRQLVLGSEGRLGILTEAIVRAVPIPQVERYPSAFLPDWDRAREAVRELAQARLPLTMIRLSTPVETETTLALAGHETELRLLRRYLSARGAGRGRCMLLLGLAGRRKTVAASEREAMAIVRSHGGTSAGGFFGRQWQRNRFRTPYLRNLLWEAGYGVDTLETAAPWSRVPELAARIARALRTGLVEHGERVHAFTHLSHVYPSGSSIYTTYLFRLSTDPDETLERWRALKAAASRAIVELGGTISHQHGVGRDHAPYLGAEKGPLGMAHLEDAVRRFDPTSIMHPGVLIADDRSRGDGAVDAAPASPARRPTRRRQQDPALE